MISNLQDFGFGVLELLDPAGMQRTHGGGGGGQVGRPGSCHEAQRCDLGPPPKKTPTLNMVILLIAKLSASG